MKTTVTIDQFRSIASLTVFSGNDSIALVINAVRIERDGNELLAMSTNRYVATRARIPVGEDTSDEFAVTIPNDLLTKFATLIKADKVGSVTIEIDDLNIVTLTNNYGVSLNTAVVAGNYPPINRLFPETHNVEPIDTVQLRVEWLVKLAKIQTPNEKKIDKDQPWTFTFYGMSSSQQRPRPNAIMATRNEIDVLIQPNITL